ncbi:MAG: hypothetical protein AAF074_19660 [Pseudomonadota bacterium]
MSRLSTSPLAALTLAGGLALAAAGPVVAQEGTDPDPEARAALERALASVNDDGPGTASTRIPGRGTGFFGSGFYITPDRVGESVGGERFGGTPETPSSYSPSRSEAILSR